MRYGCARSPAWRKAIRVVKAETIRRELRGIALALLMVAATTIIAYGLVQTLEIRRGSVIYLLPVLLAGWHLGLIPALLAAVAGVLWSGYLFFSPFYTYFVARPNEKGPGRGESKPKYAVDAAGDDLLDLAQKIFG